MNITRVKKALQKTTHLTTEQLHNSYPEFMQLCAEVEFEEELAIVSDRTKARVNQILRRSLKT